MKMLTFSERNAKEIVRDPLTVFFGLGFPVIILLLLTAIQANIPVELFALPSLAPGITIFGLSFMTLFPATLISKDRESALLQRLYTTPLTATDFILGYTLPIIPIAVLQALVTFIVSFILGLKITIGVLYSLLFIIPISIFFIGMGLLFGSTLNVKQVGGISGALFTNLCAWFSGIWFDFSLVGGPFKVIAEVLPFYHAVELEKMAYACNFDGILPHLLWVLGYAIVSIVLSILLFLRQMKKN